MLDKCDLCFVINMCLSNNPSSGDINSSNLPCLLKYPFGGLQYTKH